MRANRSVRNVSLALVAAATLAACSSTNLTNLWMDQDATSPTVDNVLVIALDRNPEMRRFWEDALSAEFQAQGLLARPSYQLFPADLPDSQQVAIVMGRDHHDAALVAHRLSVTTNAVPDGGYRDSAPAAHADYWRRGYTVALTAATQPVTENKEKEARFQLDFARADGHLVWTGTTTPVDPTNAEKLRTEVAGQVVPELQKRKIIPKD
jgi:hypothetical protein